MKKANTMPKDYQGSIIQSCSQITAIQNIAITTASYIALTIPNDRYCKSVMLKTRSGNDFRIATKANPNTYITITGPISFNIVLRENQTYAYVKADTTSDTLEILYMD